MTMMTLSEAIRLGATLGPQIHGQIAGADDATCALGSAIKAAGLQVDSTVLAGMPTRDGTYGATVVVPDAWGVILCTIATCPHCQDNTRALERVGLCPPPQIKQLVSQIVPHLNDAHRWTRERIADWIEQTFEQPERNFEHPDSVLRLFDLKVSS